MTAPGVNYCAHCGSPVRGGTSFCERCGTSLTRAASPPDAAALGQSVPPNDLPPPPPPGSYTAPPYPPVSARLPYPGQSTNGFSIASLVLGIVWVFGVGAILAVIFGFVARRQIRDSGDQQGGSGMALAGIILGFVGIAGVILWIVLVIAVVNNFNHCVRFSNGTGLCGNGNTFNTGVSGNTLNTGSIGNTGTSSNTGSTGLTPTTGSGMGAVIGPRYAFF